MSAYYNDNDAYCGRVLRKNIAAGYLPPGDVDERDIRDVQPDDLAGYRAIHLFAGIGGLALACRMAGLDDDLNICTGGFPCQDISLAGRGAGITGERSALWREMARLLGALRPRYALVENSTALLGRGLGRVLGDLAACGYDAEWDCVSAASVGAPHIRDRVFILAYPERALRQPAALKHLADGQDSGRQEATGGSAASGQRGGAGTLANADGAGRAQQRRAIPGAASDAAPEGGGDVRWWRVEPAVGGGLDGFSSWLDRSRLEVSHKLLLAYGKTTEAGPREILRALRHSLEPQGIRGHAGVHEQLSPQEVLFAYVCQLEEKWPDEARLQLASPQAPADILRSVWSGDEPYSAPPRPGHHEQSTREHPDPLQALSRLLAHHAEKAWLAYRWQNAPTVLSSWSPGWESGVRRMAHGLPHRVDRLRGLGNAVVPQAAAVALRRIAASGQESPE